jgi:CheY-like chemotaxis protein
MTEPSEPSEPSVPSAKDCVLVVDDEEDIRESLTEVVEMAGCSAIVASNGAEALRLLKDHHPCLVILDLLMPVMTGTELLDEMRKLPALTDVPVLISTSAPARAPTGAFVVPKPIDINVIWDWMRRTCRCGNDKNLRVV